MYTCTASRIIKYHSHYKRYLLRSYANLSEQYTLALFTQRCCIIATVAVRHFTVAVLFTQSQRCDSSRGVTVHVMMMTSVCFQGVPPGILLLIKTRGQFIIMWMLFPLFSCQRHYQLLHYCVFRPKAHKEEKDPGSHSLCIGSQADKEGKVEKAEVGGIDRLGGKKKVKNPPTLCNELWRV